MKTLPPWMIDAIKREEEERRRQESERPRIELPIPPEDWRPHPEAGDAPPSDFPETPDSN